MDRQIFLTLTGRRREEDGSETIATLSVPAAYFERNGWRYLLYEETDDSAPEPVKGCVKYKDNLLEVTKKGSVSTRLVFRPGYRYKTGYATPFGLLAFDLCTSSVASVFSEDEGEITAVYTLEDESGRAAHCDISIKIQKKSKKA